MFSARTKIVLILALIALTVWLSISGCAIDVRGKATALGGRIDDTAQTSLTSDYRPARD